MVWWNPSDDAKLANLFRTPHNNVDPEKLDVATVKAVHAAHFPHTKYSNFAPLYRGKARAFCVGKNLEGHRARSKAAKAQSAANEEVNLSDVSDDEEDHYDDEAEEDIEPEEVDSEDEDQQEAKMSTPPKKKPAATKKPAASSSTKKKAATTPSVDSVTAGMGSMQITAYKMEFILPHMICCYDEGDDTICRVDIFVPTLPQEYFKPDIINEGTVLELGVQVPGFFYGVERNVKANRDTDGFNVNTHEAQAFKRVCEGIDVDYDFPNELFGAPMTIVLPFKVEERITTWEILGHSNDLGTLTDDLGGQQFHFVLQVKMRKLKTKKRTGGRFRVVGGGGAGGGAAGGAGGAPMDADDL